MYIILYIFLYTYSAVRVGQFMFLPEVLFCLVSKAAYKQYWSMKFILMKARPPSYYSYKFHWITTRPQAEFILMSFRQAKYMIHTKWSQRNV